MTQVFLIRSALDIVLGVPVIIERGKWHKILSRDHKNYLSCGGSNKRVSYERFFLEICAVPTNSFEFESLLYHNLFSLFFSFFQKQTTEIQNSLLMKYDNDSVNKMEVPIINGQPYLQVIF